MYKYLVIALLFLGCFSENHIDTQELLPVYESAKDFYKQQEYDLAYKNASAYLESVENKGYLKQTGNALNLLGVISRKQGQYPEALAFYLKAVDIKQSLRDSISLSKTYNNIGTIYEVSGAYQEALRYHMKVLKIRGNAGDQHRMEISYKNIGVVYMKDKQYKEALHYLLKSLKISEKTGHEKRAANTSNDIGICYKKSNKYAEAILYHQKSLITWIRLENKDEIARAYNNIAIVYYHMGRLSLAANYASQAIASGIADRQVYAYNTLCDIYHKQGLTDKVIEYSEKNIAIAEKGKMHKVKKELLKAYEYAYKSHLAQGNKDKSIYFLEKLNTLYKEMEQEQEHFYKTALAEQIRFRKVEQQHEIAKAGMLGIKALRHQQSYYLTAIFIVIAGFTGFGIALRQRHNRLQKLMHSFPIRIRNSLSNIGGVSFYARHFPDEAAEKLDKVDHILHDVNTELSFFIDQVKKGGDTLQRFDPGKQINSIIDGFGKHTKRKGISIIANITHGYHIYTHKKAYLAAFEWFIKDSIKHGDKGSFIEVKLWNSPDMLWLEVIDQRAKVNYYYEDMSMIKTLKQLGGIVTVNPRSGGKLEIVIAFDLA